MNDVRFEHLRCSNPGGAYYPKHALRAAGAPIHCKGGVTRCTITAEDGRVIGTGTAICSDSDNFCYRIGRDIAYGRAIKQVYEGRWLDDTPPDELAQEILRALGIDPAQARQIGPNMWQVDLPAAATDDAVAAARIYNDRQYEAKLKKGLFF